MVEAEVGVEGGLMLYSQINNRDGGDDSALNAHSLYNLMSMSKMMPGRNSTILGAT